MKSIIISKAIEDERNDIASAFVEAFYQNFKILHNNPQVLTKALADGLNLEYYYVAKIDGQIVGFIAGVEKENRAFKVLPKSFRKYFGLIKGSVMAMALKEEFEESLNLSNNTIYIDVLAVSAKVQGQGIGTQLIRNLSLINNDKQITLTVTNANEGAFYCYKKNGFVEYDRKPVKHAKQKGFSEMIYMRLFRK